MSQGWRLSTLRKTTPSGRSLLASESSVVRRGEAGRVYFYQNELPYDVDQANRMRSWCIRGLEASFGDKGYAGYRVGEVQRHEACGVGQGVRRKALRP